MKAKSSNIKRIIAKTNKIIDKTLAKQFFEVVIFLHKLDILKL